MKHLIASIIAFCLLGICSVSTSSPDDTGQSQWNILRSDEIIISFHRSMTGLTADTLGVVPNGHVFVITDLAIFTLEGHNLNVELWGDSNLKLKTVDQKEQVICNFTTGIPFTSCETIWINNAYNIPIEVTVNGYFQ